MLIQSPFLLFHINPRFIKTFQFDILTQNCFILFENFYMSEYNFINV